MTHRDAPLTKLARRDVCWLCNDRRATREVGLCGECRDRLIAEGEDAR